MQWDFSNEILQASLLGVFAEVLGKATLSFVISDFIFVRLSA
jgi:hypothetical protein